MPYSALSSDYNPWFDNRVFRWVKKNNGFLILTTFTGKNNIRIFRKYKWRGKYISKSSYYLLFCKLMEIRW